LPELNLISEETSFLRAYFIRLKTPRKEEFQQFNKFMASHAHFKRK